MLHAHAFPNGLCTVSRRPLFRTGLLVALVVLVSAATTHAYRNHDTPPATADAFNPSIVYDPPTSAAAPVKPYATPLASGVVRDTLMRSSYTAEGVAFDLLLAPPIFFESVHRPDEAAAIGADKYVVFLLAEHHFHEDTSHNGHFYLMPILRIDGKDVHVAQKTVELSNDGHHRTTALIFKELPVSMLDEQHTWEMLLPPHASGEREVMLWVTPIDFGSASAGQKRG
jgi:hypothetical protein